MRITKKVLSKILKPGETTSEYKNTNKVVWVGVFLLFADKLSVLGIDQEHIRDLAAMMRNNVTEIIGAVLIFATSLSYRVERVILKIQQIKHGVVDEVEEDLPEATEKEAIR